MYNSLFNYITSINIINNLKFISKLFFGYILIPLALCLKSYALNSNEKVTNNTKKQLEPYTQELLLAEFAINNKAHDKALEIYQKIALKTNDPKIAKRATELALELEKDLEALKTIHIWANNDVQSAKAQLIAGLLKLQYEDASKASPYLEQLFKIDDKEIPSYIELLLSHPLKADKFSELETVLVALSNKPELKTNPYVYFAVALLIDKTSEDKKCLEYLNKSLTYKPDLQSAHLHKIRFLNSYQSTESALKYLEDTVAKFPDNHELRKLYADILFDLEKWPKAKKHYDLLVNNTTYQEEALMQLSYINITNNDIKQAKKLLLKLTDSEKYANIANYYLGLISEQLNDIEGALKYYQAIFSGEYYIRSKVRIASILAGTGKLEDAQQAIDDALINIDKQYASEGYLKEIILSEAELLYQQGLFQNAIDILTSIQKHFPQDVDIIYSIGILANKLEKPELFIKNMLFVINNDPNNTNALSALGWHYFKNNELKKSAQLLKQAYESNSKYSYDSKIGARYAAILWSMGERDKADTIWKKAVELDPHNQPLRDMIEDTKKSN